MRILLYILAVITGMIAGCYPQKEIPVEQHVWKLVSVDTFFSGGGLKPIGKWENEWDRQIYIDYRHDFPYPYIVGEIVLNFDKR